MLGVGGGDRRSVLGELSRLRVKKFGPSTSGGLPGRSLAPFGLWPPPTPRAPPRMALLGAIWSCRRAQIGSMLPLEHGWVLCPMDLPWARGTAQNALVVSDAPLSPGFGWYSTRVLKTPRGRIRRVYSRGAPNTVQLAITVDCAAPPAHCLPRCTAMHFLHLLH